MGHERIVITRSYYYEIDQISIQLHKAISDYQNITDRSNRINGGSMINALQDIQSIDPHNTVLITMGTPCEKISRGVTFNKNLKAKIGIHASPSTFAFPST